MVRLRAEDLLASEESRRLHPHHILLMRAKLKITKCGAANMEQLQRKVLCSFQLSVSLTDKNKGAATNLLFLYHLYLGN